jgi:hypothetical protein
MTTTTTCAAGALPALCESLIRKTDAPAVLPHPEKIEPAATAADSANGTGQNGSTTMNVAINQEQLTTAVPLAPEAPAKADRTAAKAAHRRMAHIVEILRGEHGVDIDAKTLADAEHALAYLAGQAAGKPNDAIDEGRAIYCLNELGISLDWIFRGKMDGLFWALIRSAPATQKVSNSKTKRMASEAEDLLSEMETPLHQAAHFARALRMMGSSDDVGSDAGAAIDTVADHLLELLNSIKADRDKAWVLLRKLEDRVQ